MMRGLVIVAALGLCLAGCSQAVDPWQQHLTARQLYLLELDGEQRLEQSLALDPNNKETPALLSKQKMRVERARSRCTETEALLPSN